MLLNSGDDAGAVVSQSVNIKFGRLLQKLVDQDGTIMRENNGHPHVIVQTLFVIDNGHRASAEHVTRSDEHWISDALANLARSFNRSRVAFSRLGNPQFVQHRAEAPWTPGGAT